jgi:hypothetical protein
MSLARNMSNKITNKATYLRNTKIHVNFSKKRIIIDITQIYLASISLKNQNPRCQIIKQMIGFTVNRSARDASVKIFTFCTIKINSPD